MPASARGMARTRWPERRPCCRRGTDDHFVVFVFFPGQSDYMRHSCSCAHLQPEPQLPSAALTVCLAQAGMDFFSGRPPTAGMAWSAPHASVGCLWHSRLMETFEFFKTALRWRFPDRGGGHPVTLAWWRQQSGNRKTRRPFAGAPPPDLATEAGRACEAGLFLRLLPTRQRSRWNQPGACLGDRSIAPIQCKLRQYVRHCRGAFKERCQTLSKQRAFRWHRP